MGSVQGLYTRNVGDLHGFENALHPANPDTIVRRTMSRLGVSPVAIGATGTMTLTPITLEAGDLITSLSVSVTTASATQTAAWFALYTPSGVLARQTADQTSTVLALGVKTLALSSPYLVPESGVYEVGIMCAASGTMPVFHGMQAAPPIVAAGERLFARLTSATYTTTAPATLPALVTAVAGGIYVATS
jgi:hypothetical protein